MRWRKMRRSSNVDDRRGAPRGRMAMGGGLGAVVMIVIVLLMGGDPMALLNSAQSGGLGGTTASQQEAAPIDDEAGAFVEAVLGDTEDVWNKLFREAGRTYREPKLVLFRGQVRSACGFASAASGPFYCPGDEQVYIDLSFYDELSNRFGAPGDFAQAYVIAHEIGHHVQNLLGITDRVHALKGRVSEAEYNQQSVRLELQADFFAGIWAHHAQRSRDILEKGDLEEALQAASAIGDDRIQMQSRGYVVPDSFTHGTSEQRRKWFYLGFTSGDLADGDTFSIENP